MTDSHAFVKAVGYRTLAALSTRGLLTSGRRSGTSTAAPVERALDF